jgi:hypothetical protein
MWNEGKAKLILRSQKVDVWSLVDETGLDHAKFKWSTDQSVHRADVPVSILQYVNTSYFFQFDFNRSSHTCRFSPALEQTVDYAESGTWDNQLVHVRQWLSYLEREVTTDDPWVRLARSGPPRGTSYAPDHETSAFTEGELTEIRKAILGLRAYVEDQFNLGAEQHAFIREQTDYLIEASTRQDRRDWRNTCFGVVALIVSVLGAISPEQAVAVWQFLSNQVRSVLQLRLPG